MNQKHVQKNLNRYFAQSDCVFGAVKLTKNAFFNEYEYSGYGIGFDQRLDFSINGEFGRNAVIFGVENSSPVNIDNRKKNVLS